MSDEQSLDGAYALETPEDSVRLYRGWAETYYTEFAATHGYRIPDQVAETFRAAGGEGPVLDIGAGTGLLAESLGGLTVDGIDITPEMLAKARAKGLYRALYEGDLLKPLAFEDGAYGGVISCGTFTHGHVGPACFPELLRVTRPGALFVCGTIAPVLDGAGFGSALAQMVARDEITPVRFREIAIYEGEDHPHAGDRGLVMVFRRMA